MFAFDEERTRADAWLAPRLHATLRLTRQEAADRRLWNHLALAVALTMSCGDTWRSRPGV